MLQLVGWAYKKKCGVEYFTTARACVGKPGLADGCEWAGLGSTWGCTRLMHPRGDPGMPQRAVLLGAVHQHLDLHCNGSHPPDACPASRPAAVLRASPCVQGAHIDRTSGGARLTSAPPSVPAPSRPHATMQTGAPVSCCGPCPVVTRRCASLCASRCAASRTRQGFTPPLLLLVPPHVEDSRQYNTSLSWQRHARLGGSCRHL